MFKKSNGCLHWGQEGFFLYVAHLRIHVKLFNKKYENNIVLLINLIVLEYSKVLKGASKL